MRRTATRWLPALLCGASLGACAEGAPTSPPADPAGCLPGGDGYLQARLRGAIDADLHWRDADMHCEGGMRPDGNGVRVVIAGLLPATPRHGAHRLRFIFGIDLAANGTGDTQVLPTNLTVIMEGEEVLFSTGGSSRCAVQSLHRQALLPASGSERMEASGYCIDPAVDGSGTRRLFVPTFDFAGRIRLEDDT